VRLSGRALTSLKRLQATVSALLEFARAAGRPAAARTPLASHAAALIAELRPLADEANIELGSGALPDVDVACAPGILSVLLSNLVRNAIKYMGVSPVRRVDLHGFAHRGRVRLEVHDTGPGVPPEMAQRIFEPFVRAEANGVAGIGLGLATVKRLAEAHGGRVGVHAAEQRGSVFWFDLPIARPQAPAPSPLRPPDARPAA
jgi:signal transduction histidine kinase